MIPHQAAVARRRRRSAGGGGGGWAPPTTDLVLRYDAAQITATDGDTVAQWDDASGNARHATQATSGSRPVYDTNGMGWGKAGVRFDAASGHFLDIPNVLSGITASDVFIVVRTVGDPGRVENESGLWTLGSSGGNIHYPYTDGGIYDDAGTTVRKSVGNPTPVLTTPRLYHVRTGPGEWTARLDGSQVYTTATNTVGWSTAPRLGRNGSSSIYLDGCVGEVLIYGAHLSDEDRTAVETGLLAKWSVTPRSGAGLLLQYDALAITGASDGDAIAQWDDDSGNGYHATQATSGNRPTYDVDAFGTGLPGVRFTGASAQFLRLPSVLDQMEEAHIFLVVKATNDPQPTHPGFWRLGSTRDASHFPLSDGTIYDGAGSTVRKTVGNPTPALTTARLYQVSTAAGAWTARLDTTQLHTTATNAVGWSGRPEIGRSFGSTVTYNFDGWIAEMRIYYGAMDSAARGVVESALKTKWGLTGY